MARAEIVDGAGNQFFAGPSFTVDENSGVSRGNSLNLDQDPAQRRALAHDLLKIALINLTHLGIGIGIDTFLGELFLEFTDLLMDQCALHPDGDLLRDLREEINFVLSERIVLTTN